MTSLANPLSSSSLLNDPLQVRPRDTTTTSTSAASSASSASQTSLSSLGSTFLKLLTQELQNQDPTAPMDSTQMVGQMISLNQLDQLASINQLLTTQFSGGQLTSTGTTNTTN